MFYIVDFNRERNQTVEFSSSPSSSSKHSSSITFSHEEHPQISVSSLKKSAIYVFEILDPIYLIDNPMDLGPGVLELIRRCYTSIVIQLILAPCLCRTSFFSYLSCSMSVSLAVPRSLSLSLSVFVFLVPYRF